MSSFKIRSILCIHVYTIKFRVSRSSEKLGRPTRNEWHRSRLEGHVGCSISILQHNHAHHIHLFNSSFDVRFTRSIYRNASKIFLLIDLAFFSPFFAQMFRLVYKFLKSIGWKRYASRLRESCEARRWCHLYFDSRYSKWRYIKLT